MNKYVSLLLTNKSGNPSPYLSRICFCSGGKGKQITPNSSFLQYNSNLHSYNYLSIVSTHFKASLNCKHFCIHVKRLFLVKGWCWHFLELINNGLTNEHEARAVLYNFTKKKLRKQCLLNGNSINFSLY